MADRLTLRRTRSISNMARITTRTYDGGVGVVGVGIQKTVSGMTVTAFSVGDRVGTGWCVGSGGCHTRGHSAVVASGA